MSGRFYSTANWQRIAARQLAREPVCEGCEEKPAVEVDHIKPISKGGARRDPENLQSLCRECHAGKTAAERERKTWTPPKHRGCFPDGTPRDPSHPWHKDRGGSINGIEAARPAGVPQNRISQEG